MITLESLKEIYKPGTPIFVEDLDKQFNYTKTTIRKSMSLLSKKEIKRYSRGVYYIPEESILGELGLSSNKVIEKKYLRNNNEVTGAYSGLTILNKLGLTEQVPNTIELITNKETNIKREVLVGKQKVILRRSKVDIDSENVKVVEMLEAVKMIKCITIEQRQKLVSFAKENDITRNELDSIMIYYPKKVYRNLVEGGVLNEIAS